MNEEFIFLDGFCCKRKEKKKMNTFKYKYCLYMLFNVLGTYNREMDE